MNNEEVRKLVIKYDQGNAEKKEEIELSMVSRLIDEVSFSSEEAIFLTLIWQNEIKKEQKKYDIITKSVYSIGEKQIDSELIDANLEKLEKAINKGGFLSQESAKKYCNKLVKHIDLAKIQKDYIQENLIQLENNISIANERVKEISDIKNSIYTEFVAILGIFASIIFGVFGGFQEIQLIGKNLNTTPIPKLLIFSSLVMLGITLIIFLCFNAISKLTNLPMRSCNCEVGKCNCSFKEKHPTIFYSSSLFIYMLFVGFALRLYKYHDFTIRKMFKDWAGEDALPLLLLIVPLILWAIWVKIDKIAKH
ncbi:hypothetical protein [Staphylococcus hominis]|uniref:hypothetical protein n=1 Tax=Staphylococcus hominis TaxID=1290 RepID=UPI0023039102|nr:hypothetical protein [Staphylococcus hominis]